MTSVMAGSHGGLRHHPQQKQQHRVANPFDSSDDEEPGPSNSSASAPPLPSGYSNPFDDDHDDTTSRRHAPPKAAHHHRAAEPTKNPFDDDYEAPSARSSPAKHAANGNKIRAAAAQSGHDEYSEAAPRAHKAGGGDSILDEGSLFDDDEQTLAAAERVRERKKAAADGMPQRGFADKMKERGSKFVESGARMKESAAASLSAVKLPAARSAARQEPAEEAKRGKAKQQTRDLFGEVQPVAAPMYRQDNSYASNVDLQDQTVEQLQQYAVARSQDTTSTIRNAIRVAEDTKGVATTTLETLHDQGEQIRRTHETAVRVDEELGRGEKLLGSLGGIFTRTWKPKKAHKITGPDVHADQYRRRHNLAERGALGLGGERAAKDGRVPPGMDASQVQLEMEKRKQDDALEDLSGVLGQLKGMTMEMGHEIERQNGDLDRMHDDVHELNARVRGANNRTRHLLGR